MLHKLSKIQGNKVKSKRVGRGYGSTKGGHTTGRGNKGQKARTGKKPWAGFEGGQVPLYKRLPRLRGFKRFYDPKPLTVRLDRLTKLASLKELTEVTPKTLVKYRIIKRVPKGGIKLVRGGQFNLRVSFKGFKYSTGAKEDIEKAGSSIAE